MFGKKEEEPKMSREEMQINDYMNKYGLGTLDAKDAQTIHNIINDLRGNGFFKTGMALSFAKAEEQAKVTYLSALVEQNWLIIRQLDRLNQKLDKK